MKRLISRKGLSERTDNHQNVTSIERCLRFLLFLFLLSAGVVWAEPVRILGIGNSFTVDALEQHMQPLCTAEGRDVVIGYPYRGGTWLSQHDAWSNRTDTMPYNYRKFKNGQFTSTGLSTYNMTMAMEDEPWDYVIIQSDHDSAGIYRSYVPYMEHLINFVHTHCSNPNVKIAFYMTWAYDSTSTYSSFKLYNRNQKTMYDSIIHAAQQVMANHPGIEFIIPCGTAVQNARTSYIGQRLNRDGYHLNYEYGRYIASLSWYEKIFNKSALDVEWHPSSISDYCADMCRHAVHASVQTPYAVTNLSEDFGQEPEDPIVPGTESHLKRMTVNGMNVVLGEDTAFTVKVDTARTPVALYAYPIDNGAELNITDVYGADIERDVTRPNYYPLVAPAYGETVNYTIRVISAAMGADETVYKLALVGASAKDITYPIASRADLENFAEAVNSGSYAINGEVTEDFSMNHTKQDCWMTPIGDKAHPWTGTFNGKGHTISGFNIYRVDNDLNNFDFVGLFGYIQNAMIKNLRIEGTEESYFNRPSSGSDDTQNKAFAILCGCMESSTVQDCSVSMPIFTNVSGHVGMLVGKNADVSGAAASLIQRCSVQGTWRIRHSGIYGGILGYGYNADIRDCYSLCNMSLQQDKAARIGGVIGYVNANNGVRFVKLYNCYSYGSLTDDRVKYGHTTNQTLCIGAIGGAFNGSGVSTTNCWYLEGSAPAVLGQHKNYSTQQTATSATKAQFKDGTVTTALGEAWEQGSDYPVLKAPEPDPEPGPGPDPQGIEDVTEDALQGTRKIFCHGQLMIEQGGKMYSVLGQQIH